MAELRKGDRISNYLLEEQIGAGSFGEVWRARHHVFEEVVAIKVPTDPQFVRNLQREGVTIHGLRHPNIVRAIDMDPYGTPPYLVMEYVDGPSLRAVIDEWGPKFPIAAASAIMRGMLQALDAAHQAGVIHRDVKPANILLNHPAGEIASVTKEAVKVTDFGLGRVGGVTTHSIMQSGSLLTEDGRSISGTLAYMAPEQKEGKEADAQSDLYSCGIVLFEMLTGERPQGGEVPSMVRGDVPKNLDEVFKRCYTRRNRRFGSAAEMMAALSPDEEQKATVPPPPPRTASRYPSVCPACDTPTQADDQFCIACGRQLVNAVPRCPACDAYVRSSDRFCILCGHDLRVLQA
jgi:serine/threonine protein kinase